MKDYTPKESVWLAFEDGFVSQASNVEKDADGNSVFISEYQPAKFINSDVIKEWAKKQMDIDVKFGSNVYDTMEDLIEFINKL